MTAPPWPRPGLCSVTLRGASRDEVVALVAANGLAAIEWGADVHVPPHDPGAAAEARALCADAGIAVASYGSYLQLGSGADPAPVLRAATGLGAPRIRVWAGACGSAEATPDQRGAVVAEARTLAAHAADAGIVVGCEFHGGTLTDTAESTLALLGEIDRPGTVGTYWQPPQDLPDDQALAGLDLVADHVVGVHAFSWWPADRRLALAARRLLWDAVARRLRARPESVDVLLEFVAGDDRDRLVEDAATLHEVLRGR